MSPEAVKIMTKIEDEAKRILGNAGLIWSNKNPVYREANAAFEADDVAALKRIWTENFE